MEPYAHKERKHTEIKPDEQLWKRTNVLSRKQQNEEEAWKLQTWQYWPGR